MSTYEQRSTWAVQNGDVLGGSDGLGSDITDTGNTDTGSTQPLTGIGTAVTTSNGCISWDLSAMEQHIADLERASQDLQSAETAYKQLRERVTTSWQSNAANVFLSEMCIDLDDYAKLVANINTLATALKSVKEIYSGCETEVVRNMSTLDAQLEMLGGTRTV